MKKLLKTTAILGGLTAIGASLFAFSKTEKGQAVTEKVKEKTTDLYHQVSEKIEEIREQVSVQEIEDEASEDCSPEVFERTIPEVFK